LILVESWGARRVDTEAFAKLTRKILTRLLGSAAAIFGASIFSFVFLRIVPSDPARLILGQFAPEEAINRLRRNLGLDQPLWVQYGHYIVNFFTGDWGFAYSAGQPVTTVIGNRFPATIELGLYAFAFAFLGAIICAVLATYQRRPLVDGAVRGFASFGLGLPPFWLGILLLLLLSKHSAIFPGPDGRLGPAFEPPPAITHLYTIDALLTGRWATFSDSLAHIVLPAVTLGLAPLAYLTRLLRAHLLDVSREPFILAARGKGLRRPTAFIRHALPNAFLPMLTASGLIVGQVMVGSVLVEHVFNWPGVGGLVVDGILNEDYAPVQTFVMLSAVIYVLCNLIVDILSGFADPRLRVRSSA
jgi:ABC-type dipeptide/oligopeptide/nickel transport system permease component